MLNAATPVASDPLAAIALPGSVPPDADAAAAFAQLLDQASVEQAKPGDAAQLDLLRTLADTSVQPPAAEALPGTAPRGSSPHKVDTTEILIEVQADMPAASEAVKPDEVLQAAPTHPEDRFPAEDETPPTELLAWVASLPLPPPAPATAPVQTKAAAPAARAEVAAVTDAITASATPATVEAAVRQESTPPAPLAPALPQTASPRKVEPSGPRSSAPVPATTDGASPRVDGGAWLQTLAAQREGSTASAKPATDNALPLAALPGSVISPPPRLADTGTPLQAEVRAEVGSKEFAPALGSQLSVLVRNGVEHAQLKLNPAEMGPIEVRISIDGSQAQVDFSAAHAHTRQALQDAVPALATALRESGLTLTGGGVFEQPRESRGQASTHGRQPQPAAERVIDELLSSAAARAPRTRGVLDLYA